MACYLEGLGHEVVVADTNFAPMYAIRSRRFVLCLRRLRFASPEPPKMESRRRGIPCLFRLPTVSAELY